MERKAMADQIVLEYESESSECIAVGQRAFAGGMRAVAVGSDAQASGDFAIAIGAAACARGFRAVAIGDGATAIGDNAIDVPTSFDREKANELRRMLQRVFLIRTPEDQLEGEPI
jgi:hypothetical protein